MRTDTVVMLYPLLAMVALTLGVAVRMYLSRVGQMRRHRIHPQTVASRSEAARLLPDTRAVDNFANLFELPILFYVGIMLIWSMGLTGPIYLALAWLFVILRVLHSVIHVTYNRVMHRFLAYIAGAAVLMVLWAVLAWDILRL